MQKKMKYIGYLVGIAIVVLTINVIYSQIIAFETPTFLKVIGNIDTWILFNGSIIGALAGGLIAGLIAYNIAKLQIDEANKSNKESRKIQYRDDFQRKVLLKLLELNLDLQEEFLFKDTLLKSILSQITSYNQALESGRESIDLLIKQMQESLFNKIQTLESKLTSAMNTQLAFKRVFLAYQIALRDYMKKIREIIELLVTNNNGHSSLGHHLFALRDYIHNRNVIPTELIDKLKDINNSNRRDFNTLDYKIHLLNIDIQNSFSDLFNHKIQYPEYEEVY